MWYLAENELSLEEVHRFKLLQCELSLIGISGRLVVVVLVILLFPVIVFALVNKGVEHTHALHIELKHETSKSNKCRHWTG